MAEQHGPIQFKGKLGNLVGRKLPTGKYVVSVSNSQPHNPRTPLQQKCRGQMGYATKIASRLGDIMDVAKSVYGEPYAHSKLVGKIKTWISSSSCVGIFPAEMPLVVNPGIDVRFSSLSLLREPIKVTLHALLVPEQSDRLLLCAYAIIAFFPSRNKWLSIPHLSEKQEDVVLQLEQWNDEDVQIAGYVLPIFSPQNDDQGSQVYGQVSCTFLVPGTVNRAAE